MWQVAVRRLAVPLAMLAVGVGTLVADRLTAPGPPVYHPPPPAVQLRDALRLDDMRPLACRQDGATVTCTLPGGVRCTQTIGGSGACADAAGHPTVVLGSGTLSVTDTPFP
jgi:hypothetical protein